MAVSTQLGRCVAKALGVPETVTASHVRNLREAGLITKTGRGITAAQMTTRDAAHLLIATVASLNVKDSAATVAGYSLTKSRYGQDKILFARSAGGPDHSFVDALVVLLDLVVDGEFTAASEFEYDVHLFGPLPRARIEWTNQRTKFGSDAIYEVSPGPWVRPSKRRRERAASCDLERQATFTDTTILQVGALIGGGERPAGANIQIRHTRETGVYPMSPGA
jgi:hypothetical protein